MATPGEDEASNSYSTSSCTLSASDPKFQGPLLKFFELTNCSRFDNHKYSVLNICPDREGSKGDEEMFYLAIEEKFRTFIDDNNWSVYYKNHTVEALKEQTYFLSTSSIKPGFLIQQGKVPLLFVEVVSNRQHKNTVYKLGSNLIDQLRWITNVDEINCVSGYIIPSSKCPGEVTKVTIEWKNLTFHASYEHFNIEEFLVDFKKVLENQCCNLAKLAPKEVKHIHFIKLSNEDLKELGTIVNSENIIQERSKFSILFYDDQFFYKIIPNAIEDKTLLDIVCRISMKPTLRTMYPHIVFPIDRILTPRGCSIFMFPRQAHGPLTRDKAEKCLRDLVPKVFIALAELHSFGFAHCDVRLPNICFTQDGDVRLIDLDRAHPINPVNKNDDITQLGIMIFSIISKKPRNDLYKAKDKEFSYLDGCDDPFLEQLIKNSKFDEKLFQNFKKSSSGSILDQLNIQC